MPSGRAANQCLAIEVQDSLAFNTGTDRDLRPTIPIEGFRVIIFRFCKGLSDAITMIDDAHRAMYCLKEFGVQRVGNCA